MKNTSTDHSTRNNRVLVIDDNPAIHADIRKILCPAASGTEALDDLEAAVFGDSPSRPPQTTEASFSLDDAHQGREGLQLVEQAVTHGQPYALAFVDVRMPPGWDGIETTLKLWAVSPDLQIVICTAYSDYSWDEMLARLGNSDRLVILKKPFDTIEVLQLANALTEKWNLLQKIHAHSAHLESHVRERTAALEITNAALQEEITRRIEIELDLKRAKNAAETADRAKSAFLANMSHEIRTPMNGVIGMANLLLATPLTADQRELAETLSQSSESLLTIINDILDFSKIEAGRLTLESADFDLAEQIELALDLHAEAADRKGIELVLQIEPGVPARVRGDSLRLRQVLLNLINNAIKFTPRGEVLVNVALTGESGGRKVLRFAISDSGIGVPPELRSSLFQPFSQADSSTTRRFGGTGLGLAICKRLTDLMHGQIGVETASSGGATFWFTAAVTDPELPVALLQPTPSPLAHRHALLVDDNASNRKLLAQLCDTWHLPYRLADGARSALDELRRAAQTERPFDLVVLDREMPECDGLALAREILHDSKIPRPVLVMLSTRSGRIPQEQLDAHGIAACELKPLHANKLYRTLLRVLAKSPEAQTEPPVALQPASNANSSASGHAGILVVEDNRVNQKVTMLQLRTLGFTADLAANGREAIEALRRKPYGLVFMDSHMPEMDGFEATRQIRAAQAAGKRGFPSGLRIVAMTANAMSGDREACLAAGMDDYLAKPVRPEALRIVLNRYLTTKAASSAA
jgi:signal transduction histidine kinase/PleD family two-component response regulator